MAIEYSQLLMNFQPLDGSQNLNRIKNVKTEEKKQSTGNHKEDIVSLLMHATQNNLMKMYQLSRSRDVRNYHIEYKPMYR